MIVRTWQCTTSLGEDAHAYFGFLTARVLVAMEAIPGYRGAHILRRDTDTGSTFTVMSRWESEDAIRLFTGPDLERAVVDPQMTARFASFDERAQHHVLVHERLFP